MTSVPAVPHAAASLSACRMLRVSVLPGLLALGLVACSSAPTNHGEVEGESFHSRELLQSDSNRMATLSMKQNLESLFVIMDKLYRRNPTEWKKTATSREAAMTYVRIAIMERQPWHELQDKRDVAALSLALQPEFKGDRVAAFIYAAADMMITSHGGRTSFTLIDGLDPQHVFNAARNLEIANWILNSRKAATGQPLLLSNQMSEDARNLSFEREMGKIIGRLDLIADYTTERYRRSVIGYAQGLVAGPFMQFLPVR
ncbi:MAG: hypothetical protein RR729_07205 [Comamonas sp.]